MAKYQVQTDDPDENSSGDMQSHAFASGFDSLPDAMRHAKAQRDAGWARLAQPEVTIWHNGRQVLTSELRH